MSHLRAPAARADRREGGRHGRPAARTAPAPPETPIRPQLRRLAVLPPLAVALSACAAVLFTVRSTGARPSLTLWAVLAGAVAVTLAGIVIAAVAAERAARSVSGRLEALRRTSARGESELRALIEALRRGEAPPARGPRSRPAPDGDDFDLLAAELAHTQDRAVSAVVEASRLAVDNAGSDQKLEVFLNLARRLQSLVHREISILDELENEIEDPDLLKGLFHIDHLATRIRRHAENLAVLGGAVARRQWSSPVPMTEVLRSAIAEVEQYARVKLVPPVEGSLRGHAVADVIHLLAELVENATVFSSPHTQVLLRADLVTSGLAIEVEDRGLGMQPAEQSRMNALLEDPDRIDVGGLLADGRIGLYVVSQLAHRHGIHVRLQNNIYGGVQAVLVLPQALIGPSEDILGSLPMTLPQVTGPVTGSVTQPFVSTAPALPVSAQAPEPRPVPTPEPRPVPAPAPPAVPSPAPAPAPVPAPGTPLPTGAGHRRDAAPGASHRRVPPPRDTWSARPAPEPSEHTGPPPGPRRPEHEGADTGHGRTPLPVRGADIPRPNPAEAVPGIRPQDRAAAEQNAGRSPTPLTGPVRGTMDKPRLPRRRAQEHLAPQLRGGPAQPPSRPSGSPAGHDPGLMAAFQRGVGLAQARQRQPETDDTGSAPPPGADPLGVAPESGGPVPHLGSLPGAPAEPSAPRPPGHGRTARRDGSAPAG
ncbi:ATP-binding protein [Streptomyces sp. NPDC048664]|uniref:sensor histidine kinase n=1 Tax=Streptomyces sp. NPDC048664 TaxID=3154505 RepID=UPI0034169392